MSATARSRAALRLVAKAEAPRKPAMPVVVKLPDSLPADVSTILAAARELERSTKLYSTPEAVEVAANALRRLVNKGLTALESLEGTR